MSLRGQLGRFRKQEAHLQASDAPSERPPPLGAPAQPPWRSWGGPGRGGAPAHPSLPGGRAEHTLHCTKDLVVLSLSCVAFNRF